MFTGLIKDLGQIVEIKSNLEGKLFEIRTRLVKNIKIDDSVAVNGVCLTAIEVKDHTFVAQAVHQTLEKTNLGHLANHAFVNLELAMKLSDRLGGHQVLGHVQSTAKVVEMSNVGENFHVWYEIPQELSLYVVREGSIALDGISLTVAQISGTRIMVTLIPHTWHSTQVKFLKPGSLVNVEVDSQFLMMAKYMDHWLSKNIGQRQNQGHL